MTLWTTPKRRPLRSFLKRRAQVSCQYYYETVNNWDITIGEISETTGQDIFNVSFYQFENGKIVERWQAALPMGIGWTDL